jgi:NADH-quinone oxidoreductase subunit H
MIDPSLIVSCSASATCTTIHALVMSFLVFATLMGGFAYTTWLERRLVGRFQHRVGPNRAGPFGLFQPIADGIKLIFKEDVTPDKADKVVYWIAPLLKAIPALIVLAVVPLGPPILIPWFDGLWYEIALGVADVNVGVLWLLAITSIGTYGIVLAGWSSGNKYAMLGALRSSAQMISYELSMGLGMVVPIMIASSMSITDIVNAQGGPPFLGWFVFQNPLAAALLMIALLAEVNRAPFDMPEAESELIGGYHTEYSGMKFALFFAAEYVGMIAISAIAASMFFGGYHWPLPVNFAPIFGPVNLLIKIVLFLSGMVWIRATLPRIRYDRLMALGWKVLFPLSMLAVGWTTVVLVVAEFSPDPTTYSIVAGILFGLVVLAFIANAWRRSRQVPARPDVTDSREGIGWAIILGVGAVLAAPFALYDWIRSNTGGFDGFWDATRREREEREAAKAAEAAAADASAPAQSGEGS